ncbi:hypothetical protein [Clostridioides difficile]|uniref:hypothetical protein n=1 Tax=Clostridioides difficile TaxID=1496 RepID=UPI00038C970D|nr:hypothetical protein [Clostridioides difficile]EGT4112359.1 hypothetical protein [Clostridioides difficile]EGT4147922.1 hypothetical protein [Clostridioides difficile]EGT4518513.1 hypothetical protein [Clostridioides difficile]EGT4576765.1 hypothetical protein [Clostridioides difficile]EGT5022516.1 hypothetical protein [Clostridioides difficile]
MQKDIWLYSWDDEYFASDEYESKEEAIEAAKKELKMTGEFQKIVYVGKKEEVDIPEIDAEEILERVQDRIDDEYGECGEGWITYIKEEDIKLLDNRLNEVFSKWIDEFGYKSFWFVVTDTEEIELNEVANES